MHNKEDILVVAKTGFTYNGAEFDSWRMATPEEIKNNEVEIEKSECKHTIMKLCGVKLFCANEKCKAYLCVSVPLAL